MATADLLDRCAFPDGELHLGVSGGADSVAMAVLARVAERSFTIWHIHHGVRPGADADAAFVETLAAAWCVPFELRQLELDPGPNFEARARAARYHALPAGVCVGHTANDRAETVLLNLLRGAGLAGSAVRMQSAHRPILRLTRTETMAVCEEAGIAPCEDETNRDTSNHRAAVRLRVLPRSPALSGAIRYRSSTVMPTSSPTHSKWWRLRLQRSTPQTLLRCGLLREQSQPRPCDRGSRQRRAIRTRSTQPRSSGCSKSSTATIGPPKPWAVIGSPGRKGSSRSR